MIARTLTSAGFAAALCLSACPAEATGPWGIAANGTQLNGIALQGVALHSIRIRETRVDDLNNVRAHAKGGRVDPRTLSEELK